MFKTAAKNLTKLVIGSLKYLLDQKSQHGFLKRLIGFFHIINEGIKFQNHLLHKQDIGLQLDSQIFLNQEKRANDLHPYLEQIGTLKILLLLDSHSSDEKMAAFDSCLKQTWPGKEILVVGKDSGDRALFNGWSEKYSMDSTKIKFFDSTASQNVLLSETLKDAFTLFVSSRSWLRPDLTFRYHQGYLAIDKTRSSICLTSDYCPLGSNKIYTNQVLKRPDILPEPFLFQDSFHSALMIPPELSEQIPFRLSDCFKNLQYRVVLYGLSRGITLKNLPFALHSVALLDFANPFGVLSPEATTESRNYLRNNNLDFSSSENLEPGLGDNLVLPSIQILIPFRNQLKMTEDCLRALKQSVGVRIFVTCIDNASNESIANSEIPSLSDEVVTANFPFNYSRINNHGFKNSSLREKAELLLLLNNDVVVEPETLKRLARWFASPRVCAVGAKLFYPSGAVQHAGVIYSRSFAGFSYWKHIDQHKTFENDHLSKEPIACDSITAACSMLRTDDFIKLDGFNEAFVPIGFSDSDLFTRLKDLNPNQRIVMDPSARGVHFESVSRGVNYFEDFEGSEWLMEKISSVPKSLCYEII